MDIFKLVDEMREEIFSMYHTLHATPELGFHEVNTANILAARLEEAGFETIRNINGTTGVLGILKGQEPGPVVCLRADMDALPFTINGQNVNIHACGHDANSTMVLMASLLLARQGIKKGILKVLFQPAEEVLGGAEAILESGLLDEVEEMYGLHLRPLQEAKLGQATPALCHGSSYVVGASLKGLAAHGARPHLGINVIDAAASIVNAVNSIKLNPGVPFSVKTTKLIANSGAHNTIPDSCEMIFDLRAQTNEAMSLLLEKTQKAIESGAQTVGAQAQVTILGGVPGADYDPDLINVARSCIERVLGEAMDPIITPGGEDFHYYSTRGKIKTAYIGLGANLSPGLHHPEMKFDLEALLYGVKILLEIVALRCQLVKN
ncbi:MAG: amidohydrolase [Peptococcales bacterium]|jgi:amidohydrolase